MSGLGRRWRRVLLATAALVTQACAATRPAQTAGPVGDRPAVMVKTLRIPTSEPWYTRFASHTWIDVRERRGGAWRRLEIPTPTSGAVDAPIARDEAFEDERWGRSVRVLALIAGDDASAVATQLRQRTASYDQTYRAWPGPNSNTFVERLLRETDGIAAQLDHNAVGKDWAFPGRIGGTASGWGVELELPGLGVQLGLLEGVELHLAGLTLGVGIYPLSLKLPFLPALALAERPNLSYGWSPAAEPASEPASEPEDEPPQ
ncbi:DUF3750 domain-containing protein [Engelhardtia mirabilis]|uniref:Lipoprotein n=1 Tax=Engelhardtia mirabilis TaxID=2528011 RepID=A0A518BHJ4_9BACT|nr:hypothetical protein Pla133_15230 [Planctomycetes bacterium Pla133]QDV00775.1 hypothetical protein Pla86_15220 [Planctomycetes bacterium Pla86]